LKQYLNSVKKKYRCMCEPDMLDCHFDIYNLA
jgi:hypothetical protein